MRLRPYVSPSAPAGGGRPVHDARARARTAFHLPNLGTGPERLRAQHSGGGGAALLGHVPVAAPGPLAVPAGRLTLESFQAVVSSAGRRRPVVMRRSAVAAIVIIGWAAAPTAAQRSPSPHDAHHAAVDARGARVMGFDQAQTIHHFRLLSGRRRDRGRREGPGRRRQSRRDSPSPAAHRRPVRGRAASTRRCWCTPRRCPAPTTWRG